MKYLVMECHPAYAVVLSEDGRFLKAANLHYEVGQSVTEIIQLHLPETQPVKKKNRTWMKTLGTLAACMAIAVGSLFYVNMTPYASVYMSINPEVRIDVNRKDKVLQVEGVNADGTKLIQGYSHKGKELDLVMDELVDLAMDQGYLHEGGAITLSLDADEKWSESHGDHLNEHLNRHLAEKITVTIDVERKADPAQETQPKAEEVQPIVIPVTPASYGDSDYGEEKDDDRDDEDHGSRKDGSSDYGKDEKEDGDSTYEKKTEKDDGESAYEKKTEKDDGESVYEKKAEKDDGDSAYEKKAEKDDGNTDYDRQESPESDYDKSSKTTAAVKKEAASDYEKTSKSASTPKKEAQSDYGEPEKAEEGDSGYTKSGTSSTVKEEAETDYDPPEKEKKAESDYESDPEEEEEEEESSDYEKD